MSILFLVDSFTKSTLQAGDDVCGGLEVGEVIAKEKSFQLLQPILMGGIREQQEACDNVGNCGEMGVTGGDGELGDPDVDQVLYRMVR